MWERIIWWKEILVKQKKYQNIMKMIVCKIFFCFLCLYYDYKLLRTVIFMLELSKKRSKANWEVFQYQILALAKRSEKHLASKADFNIFCSLVVWIFGYNWVTKIVNKIKFEGFWSELEAKNCFTKYLRETLVFMWNKEIWEIFNFYFSAAFCCYQLKFHFGRRTVH